MGQNTGNRHESRNCPVQWSLACGSIPQHMSRRDLESCGVHSSNQLTIPQLERFWKLSCGLCWKLHQTKGCNHVGPHGSFLSWEFPTNFFAYQCFQKIEHVLWTRGWQILMSVLLNGHGLATWHTKSTCTFPVSSNQHRAARCCNQKQN